MTLQSREAKIETSVDSRHCRRHKLILEIEARASGPTSSSVTVYDISNTGLLIETDTCFSVGESIEVELPRVGYRIAEILWTSGRLVGCKFSQELSHGAVSAARLEGGLLAKNENNQGLATAFEVELLGQDIDSSREKLFIGATLRIIVGAAILSWFALYAITTELFL